MNKKISKKVLLIAVLLVLLAGCTQTTGADGRTLPEKIIYTTTTFKDVLAKESWFTAIFVYPIAQGINFLTPFVGVVAAVILLTLAVNLIILPISINATAGQQKMHFS